MAEKKKGTPKAVPKKSAEPSVSKSDHGDVGETQSVSMYLAIGLVIGALIVGMAIGYAVAPKGSGLPGGTSPSGTSAPALNPDQLKGGELPPNHPTIPAPGSETSGTGSNGEEKPAEPNSK